MKNREAPMQYTSCQGCIEPIKSMERWEVCDNAVVLANADYYYTKEQTHKLIEGVSGISQSDVESIVTFNVKDKADKTDLEALSRIVAKQGEKILGTYTKEETDSLFNNYLTRFEARKMVANYTKIDGDTLVLNSENITI